LAKAPTVLATISHEWIQDRAMARIASLALACLLRLSPKTMMAKANRGYMGISQIRLKKTSITVSQFLIK
jgi:hypothetical protein